MAKEAGGLRPDYRPDIDGLRAVAIVLVLLYHLGVGFTKGGYIGVDVFFVISGFLIGGIIAKEAGASHFSFAHFYERRIRRLFPALFCVFGASSVFGALFLYPSDLDEFGRSLAAATLFVANILFLQGAGYFAEGFETTPLLHTWSLAVEEQFYLVFPILFLPLLRLSRRTMLWALWLAAGLSFALSLMWMRTSPESAFYLLPARAWELLTGTLLAVRGVPDVPSRQARQALGLAGLAAILIAGGAFNKNVAFPGWSALLPCFGAAAIIHSGRARDTFVHHLLARRGVVFVGLISYSLYVWHMPMIVFYKFEFGRYLSNGDRILLGVASVAVAVLSWRYVELPFRFGGVLARRRDLFRAAAAAMAATLCVAASFVTTNGLEARFSPEIRRLAAFRYDPSRAMREGECFISRAYADAASLAPECLALDPDRKNYLLLGDSHAAHLWAGLADRLPGIHLLQATASGCAPLLHDRGSERCRSVMNFIFNVYLKEKKLDGIIVAANWSLRDLTDLPATLDYLAGRSSNVIVLGPVQTYTDALPRLLTRSRLRHDPSLVAEARVPDRAAIDAAFARALESGSAHYVSLLAAMCPDGRCMTEDRDGLPVQFDYGHLTAAGATMLVERLMESGGALRAAIDAGGPSKK